MYDTLLPFPGQARAWRGGGPGAHGDQRLPGRCVGAVSVAGLEVVGRG